MTLTKTEKLLRTLENGKEYTSEQIARKTGLVNVSSTIHRLREEGITIYTNRKGPAGSKYQAYRMVA